jgi:hypothetical protein
MATSVKTHFLVHDKTEDTYFTAVVFPEDAIAVAFPADPNHRALMGWADPFRRRLKIEAAATERGVRINWLKWAYYEVSPYPERLIVRKYTPKSGRLIKKLLQSEAEWEEALASEADFEKLAAVAKKESLPTIGEYYRQVCEDRATEKTLEDEAHTMISAWTHQWPSTAELLAQLRADERDRMYLVKHYKHGWYYTVTRGDKKGYFRTKNTETLLRAFILHAEEAEKNGEGIRFAYCLREYMPEGIEWLPSPE